MKHNDVSAEAGMIRNIKDVMEMTNLPEKDFSDRVMKRIAHLERRMPASRKAPVLTIKRLAVAVCGIILMSGFSYAAREWLQLRDKAGNTVMEIRKTDSKIPDWQTKILKEVETRIEPGESAVVYFGSKEEIANKNTDQILWTTSPIEYTTQDEWKSAIKGPLANSRLSIHVPDGYQFEAGYLYKDYQPQGQDESVLTYGKTLEGKEYAYAVRKPGSGIQSVALQYKAGDQAISYRINFLKGVEQSKFFDAQPSEEQIVNINGTEAYYYDHALNWVEKSEGGFMEYRISGAAAKERLVEFAQEVLTGEEAH